MQDRFDFKHHFPSMEFFHGQDSNLGTTSNKAMTVCVPTSFEYPLNTLTGVYVLQPYFIKPTVEQWPLSYVVTDMIEYNFENLMLGSVYSLIWVINLIGRERLLKKASKYFSESSFFSNFIFKKFQTMTFSGIENKSWGLLLLCKC